MNTSANTVMGMNQRHLLNDPSRRTKGLVIVIALHLVMGYALVSGMARTGLNLITKPLEAVVIQEVIIPPPPPPPPPPQKKIETPKEVVKSEAPPLPFVPPPDVAPPTASPAISIAATTNVPPSPVVITPPPAPAPVPAPALAKPAPNRSDISVACPTQVAPVMPRKAILDGAEGVIKAQIRIKTGVIQEVVILSGPRVFHAAVKTAMLQYKCISDAGGEVVATQEFNFKLE
jgi:protein TonB